VMDMERITLSYSSAQKLRAELRELGRNLHPARFAGLRGRQWLAQLDLSLARQLARADEEGRLVVTFEIIYGHAFKPTPRIKMEGESRVSMEQMQQMLRQGRLKSE
jgi:malonyl-CoA O-methyltransferase